MVNQKLELKYKEMVRLAEKSDDYVKSSFDDFKMLSALGALLSWSPVSILLEIEDGKVLFIGFLAILFVIAFIGFFGLMKQSIVNFYLEEIQVFEEEVRQELQDMEAKTFRVAENWIKTGSRRQREVALRFYLLFYIVITLYPFAILVSTHWGFALTYVIAAVLIVVLHLSTVRKVHGIAQKMA